MIKRITDTVREQLVVEMLNSSRVGTLITDPSQEDNPIIQTNKTFETMTGYTSEEIIGRNCRFLQGEETDRATVLKIRKAIAEKKPITVVLKNYKKDGTLFWNRLNIRPVTIENELYFVGSQTDVSVQYRQIEELQTKDTEIEQLMLPIMKIFDNVAAVSLIGQMSEERFNLLITKLSDYVHTNDIDHIMVDVTGLYWQEETPIYRLVEVKEVLELMGSQLYLTGVSPILARKLAESKQYNQLLLTFASIQQAIHYIQSQ
ncbi:PAS domain-containing protein [Sporosarcina sp. PTS2304]|uniref:PAS domain-containing protein n=1 Tax=Sporosarcina sp. PTS2304 TaxID=2283194 RepID=UPI000E0D0584|nr:STAS domain-containing protein [Sporosarcina sp. PTS2304]AXI00121.1 PAS domain-containing protein [Sporosarcina sp. PTS2304]